MGYYQVLFFRDEEIPVCDQDEAFKIANSKGWRFGEAIDIVRFCDENHRRKPGYEIGRMITKILTAHVCRRCERITKTHVRMIRGKVRKADSSGVVYTFKDGPCESLICGGCNEKEYSEYLRTKLVLVSKHPEVLKWRYYGNCDPTQPLSTVTLPATWKGFVDDRVDDVELAKQLFYRTSTGLTFMFVVKFFCDNLKDRPEVLKEFNRLLHEEQEYESQEDEKLQKLEAFLATNV